MKIGLTAGDSSLKDVLKALEHRVSPGDNWLCKLMGPIVTPAGADTEFTVQHNLGLVPTYYIVNVDKNAVVYDSRRANWTDKQMFLKCTATSATIYLIIL